MPIDYFSENCKTSSNKKEFGLCDDQPPPLKPAYIDENDPPKWIGIVKNPEQKEINFHAIDNCIDIKRKDETRDKKCDGVLSYENKLIFTELKKRKGRRQREWLKEGREQLKATITRFKEDVGEDQFKKFKSIKGYVCNSLRPQAKVGQMANMQEFIDGANYIIVAKQIINIE